MRPYVAKSYFETYKSYDHMQKIITISQKFNEILIFENFDITRFSLTFDSNSKKGVHIHMKKKHAQKFECDLCEKVFETVTEGKIHRKTHSFETLREEEEVCKNCGFSCKCVYTMEVHIGKCFTDNFECGFCDAKFDDLDTLELHLRTC